MKHFVVFLTLLLFAQMASSQKNTDSFEALWNQVEKLENEALTKSALQVVETISTKAKKEGRPLQAIKALLYRSKYAMTLEENAQLNIMNDFRDEIEKATFPTKNILESYMANLYWQFFQQNRYQFYNRSKTASKIDSLDFRTWDLTILFKEISLRFEASLRHGEKLQKTPISDFDAILEKKKGSERYRPTLYDLLAQNALAFYTTSENAITRPADKFEIDNPELLSQADRFIRFEITTDDETSLQAKALCIFQQLLMLHLPSTDPYALAEVDLQRMDFVYQHAVFDQKEQRYLEALQQVIAGETGDMASSLYQHRMADLLFQQGNRFQPQTGGEHRWKIKQALELCEGVIRDNPNTRGAEKCKSLRSQILARSLQLTSERHVPTNSPSRLLVTYKNYDTLQFTVRPLNHKQWSTLENLYPQEKKLAFIKKLSVALSWKATLKNERDYQTHSTEVSMPPLENGRYLIVAEPVEQSDKTFAYAQVQATNLAVVETQAESHQSFQVIDRNTGRPIENAKILFRYRLNYDGKRLSKTLMTDKTGTVHIRRTDAEWSDISLTVSHDNDLAYFREYYIYRDYDRTERTTTYSCFLFTDRSIYRPGQPVFFKGIAVQRAKGNSSIVANTEVSVRLTDVNGQLIQEGDFKTNAYGSFSGEFVLPANGITGQFSMQVSSKAYALTGYTSFAVEEYKRPKFETSFEPIKESYKVNDSIKVHGTAIAYAGSTVTDAKVSYRVKRLVYYPRWYYWDRGGRNLAPQEIAHGETLTDGTGKYIVEFKALPDTRTNKRNQPTFRYEITADVTDVNGETHSATTYVTVGYHTLTANMSLPGPLDKDEKEHKLRISTNNLNGQYIAAKGTVKMYKLIAPETVVRPRTWAAPDYPGFSKEAFKQLFPHDAFDNEHDSSSWEKGELVWQTEFDTDKSTEIALGSLKKWKSGKYLLELQTQDKYGQGVKDVLETTLFSDSDKTLPDNQLFQIRTDRNSYQIGDKVRVTLLSNAPDIQVSVHIEKNKTVVDTKIIRLNKNSASFTVPVGTDDLGGFAVTYSYAVFNHFETGALPIQVPYPNTDLQLETVTFRDKVLPGTDETWSFKIKGPKGDQVSAELLASMYDASLDAFRGHYWGFSPLVRPTYYSSRRASAYHSFATGPFSTYQDNEWYGHSDPTFDALHWFGLYFGQGAYFYGASRRNRMMKSESAPAPAGAALGMMDLEEVEDAAADSPLELDKSFAQQTPENKQVTVRSEAQNTKDAPGDVQIRKNLQETAFFFPQLETDKEGTISFTFTTPEALTQWNLQVLAHTKNLESVYGSFQTVTQKELMVIPNVPRFLREGDVISIRSKLSNLTDKPLSGKAHIELVDALTGKEISKDILISSLLGGSKSNKPAEQASFQIDALGNTEVSWNLLIPEGIQAIQYKIIAKAGDFSDGEQSTLPVLSNRMLVTETLPMWVGSNQSKTFVLDKLKTIDPSTLKHHKLTLEVTSNPAWYAVQALPYLMEYPYECNEQTFSKYYANTLAAHLVQSTPRIREVFDQWAQSNALISNLEKNQELKSLLIQETPWLRDAQSEAEQKKRIALLFDLNTMKNERSTALNKLRAGQKSSGAWAWFNGGPDSRFVTQHIIVGLGRLSQLKVISNDENYPHDMVQNALNYLDGEFVKEYEQMKRHAQNSDDDHLSKTQIHYLYMRSFFKNVKTSKKVGDLQDYYLGQAKRYWKNKSLFSKGLLALIMHRRNEKDTAEKILRSLEENSITAEELGMYWKENTNSWYWYQAPIETQAVLIEAFSEIHPKDIATIDNLKVWLLKNKQTNQWSTTKATSDAVYALLLRGSDWLSVTEAVSISIAGTKIEPSTIESVQTEAGTGYFKTSWSRAEITSEMAEVQLSKKGEGIAWGGLYWQYFEDLDKITSAETPLKLQKKLFLKSNTDTGEEISEITDETDIKVGDLVRVRIDLRVDRAMDFVHMKDMRAAGFEPINVFSSYKWQDGLGYYEATKDASTNFFFDHLPKGVFVFEYDLRVNNAGTFSNGITTIQSMYAPEFSSHSEGTRVQVD